MLRRLLSAFQNAPPREPRKRIVVVCLMIDGGVSQPAYPHCALDPFDQFQQTLYGISLGNILLDADLAAIEAYLLGSCTHVAVIRIGHFAGSVDDTAHDSDFLRPF